MNNIYNKLQINKVYNSIRIHVSNVYLTNKFLNKLSLISVEDFSIIYFFSGDCLSKIKSLTKGIKFLSISSLLNLINYVINAICKLDLLTNLSLYECYRNINEIYR